MIPHHLPDAILGRNGTCVSAREDGERESPEPDEVLGLCSRIHRSRQGQAISHSRPDAGAQRQGGESRAAHQGGSSCLPRAWAHPQELPGPSAAPLPHPGMWPPLPALRKKPASLWGRPRASRQRPSCRLQEHLGEGQHLQIFANKQTDRQFPGEELNVSPGPKQATLI